MTEPCEPHREKYENSTFCLTHDSFYENIYDDICWQGRAIRAEAAITRLRNMADHVSEHHGPNLVRFKPQDIYDMLEYDLGAT